ncbi:MAG: alpha/beta fold hydrolase [Bryobacterales bacterium]|nr:alpha/beta fold hydrolase [Bryobacterales bacterium]
MSEDAETWICRKPHGEGLAVFVHGFSGGALSTWNDFPNLLEQDGELLNYDFCFWGYPSGVLHNPLVRLVWSDDPDLDTLGRGLRTLLDNTAERYKKIVLVGHSMGGLVIQLFILGEISNQRAAHLGRLTEVILYGTPSGGLVKAGLVSLFNTQAADMSRFGALIRDLRYQWQRLIDDRRAEAPQPFRLTLVAGMEDKFVPQSTSLDPFPFDEKEIVPGNHVEMVKPRSSGHRAYEVLKKRLKRQTPTTLERRMIDGVDSTAVALMSRVAAALQLDDTETLMEEAVELLGKPTVMPRVERALGLALLDVEEYSQASQLLRRYVDFRMPDSGFQPFCNDAQALQQLAIAQSGTGDITGAAASLNALDGSLRSDPETQGILAGRFKRQWLKAGRNQQVARRALALYESARDEAHRQNRADQAIYNGINAAYLKFAIGEDGYQAMADEVLKVTEAVSKPDYWSEATRAECLLLLQRYPEARAAYRSADRMDHAGRHWTSTGQQALDILERQGRPAEGGGIADLFRSIRPDFATA